MGKSNLIIQVWIGKSNPMVDFSTKLVKEYAETIGADYKFFTHHVWDSEYASQFQVLHMFDLDEYDTIVSIDCDIYPRRDLDESIFDDTGNALNFDYRNAYTAWKIKAQLRSPRIPTYSKVPGFNGGVYKFNYTERKELQPFINRYKRICKDHCFHDEGLLHVAMGKANYEPSILADKWNWRVEYPYQRDPRQGNLYHIMHNKEVILKKLIEGGLI